MSGFFALILLLAAGGQQSQDATDATGVQNDAADKVAEAPAEDAAHPEAFPYDEDADADALVDAALARAAAANKRVILVLGANWCHDSRILAGWFETERFAEMLEPLYEVVYIDVGVPQRKGKGRNQHLIKRFKGKKQKNTPYVMVLSPAGKLLNRKDARSWRNAASRSEDEIFGYFADFGEFRRDDSFAKGSKRLLMRHQPTPPPEPPMTLY
ncbi:MAG: thioredoxin family protein [Sphingorhabdus sp.]